MIEYLRPPPPPPPSTKTEYVTPLLLRTEKSYVNNKVTHNRNKAKLYVNLGHFVITKRTFPRADFSREINREISLGH